MPRYAGFWVRLIVTILDVAFLWISEVALVGSAWQIGLLPMTEKELGEGLALLLAISFWLFPAWPYFTMLECSTMQGTLGKRLFGLKVTDLRGRRIGFGRANGRYWAKLFLCLPFLAGFVPIAFTPRKQGLHDLMAKTLVVWRRGRVLPETDDAQVEALAWQVGVWNGMSEIYLHEIDRRFAPVVDAVMTRARLTPGERVLDLGTGTGAVAERAAEAVGPGGHVVGVDISPQMLALARARVAARGFAHVTMREGRAEAIPADDDSFDVVLASLSLMYAIDRGAAAREMARVLRPGGRVVAAVWAGPDDCDIVRFQQTAGSFAGPSPAPVVGPGALADPRHFLQQLATAGIEARVEAEVLGFHVDSFAAAWDILARVTTANLAPELQSAARQAVLAEMYPDGDGPRDFRNVTQFILGRASKET
jgi:SAM-dependent methyltransferase